jgi:diphthamide biosynthesis protein 2
MLRPRPELINSCCPDVLSCLHLPADFLVHYGHACLTPTDALPVHYVFPRRKLDIVEAGRALLEASSDLGESHKGVMVVWDVSYDWLSGMSTTFALADKSEEIISKLSSDIPHPISFANIRRPSTTAISDRASEKAPALRSLEPPEGLGAGDCVIWYIGDEGRSSLNLQMTHAANPVCPLSLLRQYD